MNVRLHARMDGPTDAPVVALASSIGTALELWDPVVPLLGEQARVLRFDLRGHGRSPVPPGPYALSDLADDVLALLDEHGVERVSWCGLSLGGMVGMWLAAHAPDRIDRLVLCCTSAYLPPRQMWVDRAAAVRAGGMGAILDTVLARWFTPEFTARDPDAVARVAGLLAATPPEGYAACCHAIEHMDLRPDLPAITAPTLVVAAERDPATPPEHGRAIADAIPGARYVVIPDTAHLAPVERPLDVTRALVEHLFQ